MSSTRRIHAMARRRCRLHRPAFTLIELLVVVAIIALLISILLPSLGRAREQARLVTCLAHMRGTGQLVMLFANDHDGRMQLTSTEFAVQNADASRSKYAYGDSGELLAWPVALAQANGLPIRNNWDWGVRADNYFYAKEREKFISKQFKLMQCPSDRARIATPFFSRGDGLRGAGNPDDDHSQDNSPGPRTAYWGLLSFAINEDITGAEYSSLNATWGSCWRAVYNDGEWTECIGEERYGPSSPCFGRNGFRLRGELDKIESSANLMLLVDAGPENDAIPTQAEDEWTHVNLIHSGAGAEGPFLGHSLQANASATGTRVPMRRHVDGNVNVLYVDGHGATAKMVETSSENAYNVEVPKRYAPRVRVSPYSMGNINVDD